MSFTVSDGLGDRRIVGRGLAYGCGSRDMGTGGRARARYPCNHRVAPGCGVLEITALLHDANAEVRNLGRGTIYASRPDARLHRIMGGRPACGCELVADKPVCSRICDRDLGLIEPKDGNRFRSFYFACRRIAMSLYNRVADRCAGRFTRDLKRDPGSAAWYGNGDGCVAGIGESKAAIGVGQNNCGVIRGTTRCSNSAVHYGSPRGVLALEPHKVIVDTGCVVDFELY